MKPEILSKAVWIGSRVVGGALVMAPAPYLRKTFLLGQAIQSAQLAVTARGLYECEINGQKVGDAVFAPGWTDYRKTLQYQTYDVTTFLCEGENAWGAILGDGWYCGRVGWLGRQFYGDRPGLLAQLTVQFRDGSSIVIASDSSWKTATGPILESDIMAGETYDARLELGPWSQPGFDDAGWEPVLVQPEFEGELVPLIGPPARRVEELVSTPGRKAKNWPPDALFYDLGQNFTGRVRLKVEAPRGTPFTLRFAEILDPDGNLYTENLREARVTDYYTCKGGGPEVWEPRFTFHGFRHVEVRGIKPGHKVEVTGVVLHSDMPPTGHFACSNPLLNQLQRNIVWGQKSNFLDVPTDCPQRNERLGWTGDAQVFIRTAAFNMDVRGFFHKWLRDIRDAQLPDGGLPPIVPNIECVDDFVKGGDGGPAWSDAIIICPWTIYLCYADRDLLATQYPSMVRFMDFIAKKRCVGLIRSHPDVDPWGGFGDWLALDGGTKTEGITPRDLIGTAFYAYCAGIMAQSAAVLGHENEAQAYRELHGKIVAAFRHRFITPEGLLVSGTQTAYVLALHFGLIPDGQRVAAVRELVRDIESRQFHLATGFVGTPYLLSALEEHGHLEVAYKLLEQETFPSWLFPVKNGATTIWERWDGWTPDKGYQSKGMNSYNHYAYGAVGAWMVGSVAGLELDPEDPGYRHILFRPRPGGSLTWAEARLETPQGPAGIRWDLGEGELKLALTVPSGSRATLDLPQGYGSAQREFKPGSHTLVVPRES
jgi:alpha-L-rhamnosidase